MSRVIQQIASVQFQVQNRQANAAMQALQEAAKDLSKNMDDVNKKIAALGKDIPKDNPQLLNYQNQLRSLDKDLKDVQKAQRDFLRGAKAADQLWKAAQEQNIESLSFRAIKAGQNGLRKRQEGLSPGDAKDMQDWRIIKQVIDEADRVVKEAGADVQHVIQTIREGGKVSEQTMRQTISTLKELKGSVDETDADFGKWGTDLDFMEAKLKDFSEAQRRARGEIVDANDARREMLKLTEEGAAAAKREAEEADREVATRRWYGKVLMSQREQIKQNIELTQQQIDDNHKIIEEKHRQLAADEETFNAEQQGRHATIEGLKTQAEAERKLANEKSDAAETHRRAAELQKQTTEQLGEKVTELQDQLEVERQTSEERGKSNKQSKEELRLKGELETAQGKLAESKQRENDEQQKYVKLQGEAIEQGNKAAAAENKVADAQSEAIQKQVDFNKKQQEGLDNINQMAQGNQALQQSLDGLNGELEQNSKDIADNATKTAEAEAKKAKARQLSIKTMEDLLAKLKEEYYTEELTAEKREEHKQKIKELDEALRLAKGEWMSYGDAMKYANSIGSDGFMATDEQTKMATDALTRHREELIKTIQQKEAESQATSAERAELEKLNQALMKIKTGFSSADDVMARWAEHMNAGKTTTESMNQQTKTLAQTLEEKLAGATSRWDESIEREKKRISEYNEKISEYDQEIKKFTENIEKMEKELAELEQKHANSSWFRKRTREYRNEGWRIEDLRKLIGKEHTDEDGYSYMTGEKGELSLYKGLKKNSEEHKEWWENELKNSYRLKAAELGITEEEVAAEEKKAEAKKLTNEQMQQGINLLEEEYAKTDHTTEEGIKRRQELRTAIDQMNQELKESTGEWMSLADAKNLAEKAGTDGFMTSPQEIQKATQALERHRDAIIQTIKAKRDSGAATDAEEKELTDLTKKLKDLKFEQDNFNMSQAKMQELMRTPTNAVSLDELKAAIKRADGELKRMEGSLGKNSTKYKEFAAEVKNAKNVMKEMEGQAKASATAWEKAWSRLKTYVGLYMGFNIVWQKMQGAASDLMTLSDKMGEVRKTTGFTADEVGRLSDNLKRLDVRTTLTGLMEISAKAGQLGLKTEQDVMGFTEAANKLMIALPEMGAEAATEMMKVALATGEVKKIQDQLNKGIVEGSSATEVALSKIGSTIDQLRANSAAAAPQITDFVKRVGAVGAQSGITIDQIAALGATVDAVGLRVEMSATALSRMIPAIRNNAFEVAKAIGMAPNALREMFDEAGGGMEAMLAIFQHIKDSGMDPDSIEKMLNMGNMQDVMKQLNQQGARAGIVFAGLAQNVDELRKNLGVAAEAYEDNIAILQEYNKMNDTAAGKWERFKNEVEEFFVGDTSQRLLGGLISVLRGALDIFIGSNGWSAALRTIGVYFLAIKFNIAGIFSGVKNISVSLRGIAMAIGLIDKETKKLAWGNIFTALAMAGLWAWRETVKLKSALDKASESLGKTKVEVSRSIDRFESYWTKLKSTSEALIEAKANHEKLSAEVDKLRKSTDGSAESTANLKKKEDELTTSEKNVTKASNDHKGAIAQMNSIYGKYLGFILTESNYSNLAAAAHDKVTAAIEREMLMKQRQAAIGEVDSNYSDNIATGYGDLNERLVKYGQLSRSEAAKVMSDMQRFMRENLKYDAGTNATVVSKAIMDQLERNGLDVSKADANEIAALWFDQYLEENYHLSDNVRQGLTGVGRRSDLKAGWGNVSTPFATNLRGGYAETYAQREQARGAVSAVYDVDIAYTERMEAEASGQLLDNLEKSAQDAKKVILDKNIDEKKRGEAYIELANALEGLDNRINELDPQKDAATINRLNEMAESLKGDGIDIKKLKQAREKINQTLFERATFNEEDIRNLDTTNPWGSSHEASSTDWKNMTAEQLVNRRKQMKDFVNSIQTDSDVKTVLGEDAALKKAIENGLSSDMRTVIEWYNTERLKIQEELYNRHLTNTGDWRDPKSGGSWRKQLQTDFDTYLRILDAYYTERKAKIEKAQTEEGMSEAEAQRLVIENETVWRKHRMELQQIYQGKSADIAKGERQRIYDILAEQDEDTAEMVEKTIGNSLEKMKILASKSEVDYRKVMSKLTKDIATDLYKQQNAVANQMEAIQKIIAQERPFDGLVENLEKNLSTMGILFAELDKKRQEAIEKGLEPEDDTAKRGAEATMKRMLVLMQQAEDGYTVTFERLKEVMIKDGFADWADAIENNDQMRKAMMAMLRNMYDDVHAAIKKESSQIKKELDIWWNDVEGDGKLSRKGGFEKMLSDLGLQEEQVKRANSLIGAGAASERVADKLAIQQMRVRLAMQNAYYAKMRQIGELHVKNLEAEAEEYKKVNDKENYELKMLDAKHARQSLNLSLSEEQTKVLEQQVAIQNQLEESQNRLYEELREWGDLLASSLQSIFEASHAGDAEYYNELAKLNLTGKGGPGAGTYIVIDNEGTSDAQAHYEYLDERQALERQREIENQNAQADAWKKVWDDLNNKMNEQITDQLNALLQNQAIDANTQAIIANTEALYATSGADNKAGSTIVTSTPAAVTEGTEFGQSMMALPGVTPVVNFILTDEQMEAERDQLGQRVQTQLDGINKVASAQQESFRKVTKAESDAGQKMEKSNNSTFAKMVSAANMYGAAYAAVTNDNLSWTQKFGMMAVQAAGNTAITLLTAKMSETTASTVADTPAVLSKLWKQLGWGAVPVFALFTGLLGGLMGLATSAIAKGKSEISQVTGASVGAGRLSTGMLTYAEGNVNEFTDPSTLTPGRSYNVDAADGRTYRAKYTGSNPRTHITSGPEFHLVGEAGREAIIDAKTTRNIQLNEPEIWRSIQTLYNGGVPGMRRTSRMGRGVRAYADGNLDDFEEMDGMGETGSMSGGMSTEMMMSLQASMDRQSDLLERALNEGIKGVFDVHGSHGLVSTYDRAKKEAQRHGVKYT